MYNCRTNVALYVPCTINIFKRFQIEKKYAGKVVKTNFVFLLFYSCGGK